MIFFAFGNGFSGTRTMAKLLDLPDNVDCGHERKTPESPLKLFDNYQNAYDGSVDPAEVIRKERLPEVRRTNKHFGEVNSLLGYYVKGLYEVWPDAKFIHIYRDPKTHIPTAYNRGMFIQNDIMKRMAQWWPKPRPDVPWDDMTRLEKCAWWWADYNEFVLEQFQPIPDNQIFTIRFEEFINNIRIEEMFDFLNLPMPPQVQVDALLQKKLGKVDYKKMAEIRGVTDPIMELSSKQIELCEPYYKNTLIKLETL